MAAERRSTTSRPTSFQFDFRAPKLLLRHAHPRGTVWQAGIGEDEALKGKGWLRWAR
jgi:hypothetical protein